jgi:2-haloacid dehalogenase
MFPVATVDVDAFDALTFDCYGTLIDWETGLLAALHSALDGQVVTEDDEALLQRYARHEAALEAGPYLRYRDVLANGLRHLAAEVGGTVSDDAAAAFGASVADWPAFPDSADALASLHRRFTLAVITNCDDDLFAASARRLGTTFDEVVTAQQARSYKPATHNFELMFERLGRRGIGRDRVLHVAQSLFHDHVPAKALGLTTVWVNRRHDRPGSGATPPASALPDLTVPDMATLARLATGEQA